MSTGKEGEELPDWSKAALGIPLEVKATMRPRVLEPHQGSPTLTAFFERGEDLRPPPQPGCKDCRVIGELCGWHVRAIAAMAAAAPRRPAAAMELDALNSILRVLEPLDLVARERCLAAARCVLGELTAAQRALEGLDG